MLPTTKEDSPVVRPLARSTPSSDQGDFKAQYREDVLLNQHFGGRHTGVFVEVGAFDGVNNSNTWFFEQTGWSGVLVEPNPDLADRCRQVRPNSRVFQCAAVADRAQPTIRLDRAEGNLELSSISVNQHRKRWLCSQGVSTQINTIEVVAKTIDDILEEAGIQKIDFITIDVEGFEFEALQGFTLSRFNPEIVIVERNTILIDKKILRYLNSSGYEYFRTTGSNDWFRKSQQSASVRQGISLRIGSIAKSNPLRQRIAILLDRVGLLSSVFKMRNLLCRRNKASEEPIGLLASPSFVRAVHYIKVLWGLLLIKILSFLAKRPFKTILGPVLARLRCRDSVADKPILVTNYGLALGDTIAFLPVLRVLLESDLKPTPLVVMPARSKSLVEQLYGDTSQILFYDASRGWWHTWRFFRKLGKQGVSQVLDFTVDTRLWQWEGLCHLLTSDKVAGFLNQDGVRCYYDTTKRVDEKEYITTSYSRFLKQHAGITMDRPCWDQFPLSLSGQEKVKRFLTQHGIVGKRMLAVFPTTGRFKHGVDLATWPFFGELVEQLCNSSDSNDQAIVLFGEPRHREHIKSLVPSNSAGRVVCASDFTICEVAGILQQAACVVTTNSGFLHIACNLHVPTVLFPTAKHHTWVPDNGYAHQVFCKACEEKKVCTARPPLQRNCYRNISVDRVMRRIKESQRDLIISLNNYHQVNDGIYHTRTRSVVHE